VTSPTRTLPWHSAFDAQRRDWLRRLAWAGAAAATGSLPLSAWANARLRSQPFAWGVASGSPRDDGMVLWTRLAPAALPAPSGPAPLRWELADDEHFRRPVRSGTTTALPELGHSVHVELAGLPSDRWYFYRFTLGDATSPTGRTRTLAAPGAQVQRFRFAFASCQRWEHGYYAAWRHLCAEQPDAVVFLGDYIYEYASPSGPAAAAAALARSHTLRRAHSLADYRDRYALHRSDPDLQAAHALCPWVVTWDDHEVENDYAGDQGQEDPQGFLLQRSAAYQAFYENMPLRASALVHGLAGLGRPDAVRVHDRLAHGQLLRFHVLDTRQHRDWQACRAAGTAGSGSVAPQDCPSLNDPGRSLLGAAQERWLQQGLTQDAGAGGPRWSVLAQQTLFSQRNYRAAPHALYSTDSWDGYPAARQRLLGALAQQPPRNTVFIGGDIHQNYVCRVLADDQRPDSPTLASEFCGTSISSRSGTTQDKVDAVARRNPHVLLAQCEQRGYSVVDVTPTSWTTRLQVLDDATRPDAHISTLARFVVEDGRPGPVRDA
jgi:alkaline phosphatase D